MIKYSLGCDNSHEFEGWFATSEEYDRLRSGGHLDCPQCGSSKIEKLLMAPSVRTSRKKQDIVISEAEPGEGGVAQPGLQLGSVPAKVPGASAAMPTLPPEIHKEIVSQLKEIKKQVMASAEDVGERFGSEARKIHYGEAKKRGIYGQASPEEAADLLEEGIDIIPLPVLPEERN